MSDQIRVLIADDHPLYREGVALTLDSQPDLTVVAQAGNTREAFTLTQQLAPDIVLLDITLPEEDGLVLAQRVTATCPTVRIVMLTASEEEADLINALKAGAGGYVLKGVAAKELVNIVRLVAAGGMYISPGLSNAALFDPARNQHHDLLAELTERERDVLCLVGKGLTNREIGEQLHLAEKTVKHYMTNVLQKLQVRTRVEAALWVQRNYENGQMCAE